jgi:hypothetical protein
MQVTSDFECGNGKNITRIAPGHFRVEEEGEKTPYCKYFCVRIDGGAEGAVVRLDIHPDPKLGESGRVGFMGHFPSQLWFSETQMRFWQPVVNRWPGADVFGSDFISTTVAAAAGKSVYVATNPVWPYSAVVDWAKDMQGLGAERSSLGKSFEGRDIPRLHLPPAGAGAARPRVLVLSGQHPSEHCACMGAAGIAEFLLSSHPEARSLREALDVWVIPMFNVDGNVHGRNGWTVQDVNPCTDFLGAATGAAPKAVEDQALWRWLIGDLRPDMIFHFHGYMGTAGCADPPYDGCYIFKDPAAVYGDPAALRRYRRAVDALYWDLPGLSALDEPPHHEEDSLDLQLARACGTVSVFYEINHGFAGVKASRRRGADVFRGVMRSLLDGAVKDG